MKKCGLLTFEDIVDSFEKKFNQWANDCSRISDYVIGEEYSVFDILILAQNYDTRSGGMFVLEAGGKPTAVVIKATLSGGRYPNVWIEEPTVLKYYLKSILNKFKESYKPNNAIINNPGLPIVTFTRDSLSSSFVFRGIFRYRRVIPEDSGAKAFVLYKHAEDNGEVTAELNYVAKNLERSVALSISLTRVMRLERLANAPKRPVAVKVVSTAFERNSDVIAEVLFRAAGVCESCQEQAPFIRRSNSTPYLEVHHRRPLAMGGDDTVEYAIAVCPNCHREQHFGYIAMDASPDGVTPSPSDPIDVVVETI